MGESYQTNSEPSFTGFMKHARDLYDQHKFVTWYWRIGESRSLTQNSLFHVWLTELAAHLIKCHKDDITKGMIEGTKRTVKGLCYRTYGYEWLIHEVKCPITKRSKRDYTSSSTWLQGEMFIVLTFLQNYAASEHGLVLESKGEFNKLQREQMGQMGQI